MKKSTKNILTVVYSIGALLAFLPLVGEFNENLTSLQNFVMNAAGFVTLAACIVGLSNLYPDQDEEC